MSGSLSSLAERKALMLNSYRNFLSCALELGLTTPDAVAQMEAARLQARGDECYVQSPILVDAWVRRQDESGGVS